jgi:hypothetical protein
VWTNGEFCEIILCLSLAPSLEYVVFSSFEKTGGWTQSKNQVIRGHCNSVDLCSNFDKKTVFNHGSHKNLSFISTSYKYLHLSIILM